MNLFETVKNSVTVKQAAERYGYKDNRSDMICCPFHDDRHPSMKLNRDYFYCFGCGATGDVIDFVARLFGLSSYEAAKKLAHDFGIDPDKPPAAVALKKPYPLARAFRNDEMYCQRVLCDYLHLLERWKVEYVPQSPEDELDDRFVEACHMIEYVNDLLDVLMFAELKQRVKAVDMLLKDGTTLDDRFVEACQMLDYVEYLADLLIAAELEQRVKIVEILNKDGLIAGLEERLDRLKKEDNAHEKQNAA